MKANMNICGKTALAAAVAAVALASSAAAPDFKLGSVPNPTSIHIQRTMKALEESTAEKPATVRMLFYGQSIVAQKWPELLVKMMKEKYPTANIVWENRAIGGFTSPSLTQTSWSDLFPFYPDILFFHVYGPIDKYEEIVKNTRALTSAEIVLWSSHLKRDQDPKAMLAERDQRTKDIKAVAERNKCMFIDLNKKWCEMLLANNWPAGHLLVDGIHMNGSTGALKYYAGFIGEELCRVPGACGEPDVSGTISEFPVSGGSGITVADDGSIKFSFTGNRVVAVSSGKNFNPAEGAAQPEAELFLDGRPVASYKEMWYCTRPSKVVSWMPMINRVKFNVLPEKEDWALTYIEGTDKWAKPVHFKVEGTVTGFDGEGWSTNSFVSKSGRAVIDKGAYGFAWQYDYFVKKRLEKNPKLAEKAAKPGDKVTWSTLPLFASPFVAQKAGDISVLVQNCSNGRHILEIRPKKGGAMPGIEKFVVYAPAR